MSSKSDQILEILNHIETHFPVNDWHVGDMQLWPVLRAELYYRLALHAGAGSRGEAPPKSALQSIRSLLTDKYRSVSLYFGQMLADFKKEQLRVPKCDVIFLRDTISTIKLGTYYYNRLCDPFIDYLQASGIRTANLDAGSHYRVPRYYPSRFIQPALDLRLLLSKFNRSQETSHLPSLDGMNAYLQQEAPFIPVFDIPFFRKRAQIINVYRRFFRKVLRSSGARVAIMENYAGDTGFGFIAACKDLQIKVADIQHGVQGPLHAIYGGWMATPDTGYQLLPDFFFCWSELERETISKWGKSTHRALITGNPFLDMCKADKVPAILTCEKQFAKTVAARHAANPGKKILFTMQYAITAESDLAVILNTIRETQHVYNWFIRLHPGMLEKKQQLEAIFSRFNIFNYEMEQATQVPLYAVLPAIDIHITHSSTVVMEAAHFGIRSIVFSERGKTLYAKEIAQGNAFVCMTTGEIISILNSIEKTNLIPSPHSLLQNAVRQLLDEGSTGK